MAIDSMNKVIHEAVRRDLARVSAALAGARDGDRERAAQIARGWSHLRDQLRHHHEQEDALIFPALPAFSIDPALVAEMETEHGEMSGALTHADGAMTTYAASGSTVHADLAATAVRDATEVVTRHLEHEEADLEPLIRPHLESKEWRAVEKQLRKQPIGVSGRFFAWLLDGASPEARDFLTSTIPKPVLTLLSRGFGRGYRRDIAPVWT